MNRKNNIENPLAIKATLSQTYKMLHGSKWAIWLTLFAATGLQLILHFW